MFIIGIFTGMIQSKLLFIGFGYKRIIDDKVKKRNVELRLVKDVFQHTFNITEQYRLILSHIKIRDIRG